MKMSKKDFWRQKVLQELHSFETCWLWKWNLKLKAILAQCPISIPREMSENQRFSEGMEIKHRAKMGQLTIGMFCRSVLVCIRKRAWTAQIAWNIDLNDFRNFRIYKYNWTLTFPELFFWRGLEQVNLYARLAMFLLLS